MSQWSPLGLLLLDDLLQVVRHGRERDSRQLQVASAALLHHDVDRAELGHLVRVILAEVPATALLPLDRRSRDGLGYGQQVSQIERGMPAGVVLAMSADANARRPILELRDARQRVLHLAFGANNADQ